MSYADLSVEESNIHGLFFPVEGSSYSEQQFRKLCGGFFFFFIFLIYLFIYLFSYNVHPHGAAGSLCTQRKGQYRLLFFVLF